MINTDQALKLVKARLNRVEGDTTLDPYFMARITAAAQEIEGTGIQLEYGSVEDLMAVVDLAVWNYQNRDKQDGMPDWMRYRLRNRWLREGAAR